MTHVDGSARVQTVSATGRTRACTSSLDAFAERRGAGVLCNTSLNFKGRGFINRMSHLIQYCELRGISDMVVDGTWFRCTQEVVPGLPTVDPATYPPTFG